MDYSAIKTAVTEWLAALAESDPKYEWAARVDVRVDPAFLVATYEGDGEEELERARTASVGAASVKLLGPPPEELTVDGLADWIAQDRTLGRRVRKVVFERSSDPEIIGILVVTPL